MGITTTIQARRSADPMRKMPCLSDCPLRLRCKGGDSTECSYIAEKRIPVLRFDSFAFWIETCPSVPCADRRYTMSPNQCSCSIRGYHWTWIVAVERLHHRSATTLWLLPHYSKNVTKVRKNLPHPCLSASSFYLPTYEVIQ